MKRDPRFTELSTHTYLLGEIEMTAMPRAAKCVTYGTPSSPEVVSVIDKQGNEQTRKVLGHERYHFSVPDDQHGVQTVAMACGYGYPVISPHNAYSRKEYDKLGIYWGQDGIAKFTVPTIAISPLTTDFYALWGLPAAALIGSVYKDAESEAEKDRDRHDVYQLLLGLPAGGILFQSSTSGAITEAVKLGDIWSLSLLLPTADNGFYAGEKYYQTFKAAYDYYHKKHFRELHRYPA